MEVKFKREPDESGKHETVMTSEYVVQEDKLIKWTLSNDRDPLDTVFPYSHGPFRTHIIRIFFTSRTFSGCTGGHFT